MLSNARVPRLVVLLAALLGSSVPGVSVAAPSGRSAEETYELAQQHYIAGRHAQALPLFRELARESDSPNAWFYVARCLREMGRLVDAYEAMNYTAACSEARARTEPRFAETAKAARKEASALEARIGRIELDVPAPPPGLEIEINGRPISASRWAQPVAVMPGNARIWASAPGRPTNRQEVDVPVGSVTRVTIVLGGSGAALPPGAPTAGAPASTSSGGGGTAALPAGTNDSSGGGEWTDEAASGGSNGGLLAGGIVATLVGVGGWVVMGVLGSMANDRFDEVEATCNHQRCTDPSLNDSIEEGRTWDTVANVGLVAGLVGTVLGGVLFTAYAVSGDDAEAEGDTASDPPSAPEEQSVTRRRAQAASIEVVVSPGGWLGVAGSF